MHTLMISNAHVQRYKALYPLITQDAVHPSSHSELKALRQGAVFHLVDDQRRYIATGYLGYQNRGIGWVISKNPKEHIGAEFFTRKLINALDKRMSFYKSSKTEAFRIFNGEGDGFGGVTIDVYAGHYLINWYSKGAYAFREEIVTALHHCVAYESIYEICRFPSLEASEKTGAHSGDASASAFTGGRVRGAETPFPILVKENGVFLNAFFDDGAMTGFFPDQRDVRLMLKKHYSRGKRVLNTFSYTGAFSVFAALGGAHTTGVDLAARSVALTEANFRANGIDPADHEIRVMDVFAYFDYAQKNALTFDTVILDPPSFAQSKAGTFTVERNYADLVEQAARITAKKGTLIASTNLSTLSEKRFEALVDKGLKAAGRRYRIRHRFGLPQDFRSHRLYAESQYLKVVFAELDVEPHKNGG